MRENSEVECWRSKIAYDEHFQEAFSGVRHSKEKFCAKFLEEFAQNQASIENLDELKRRALTVFAKGLEKQPFVSGAQAADLDHLESSAILDKKVIGKEDVDIAALIHRLGNSDWVRQGLSYVSDSGGLCPFCQQEIKDSLFRELNGYFDETYLSDIDAINKVCLRYEACSADVLGKLDVVSSTENAHLDTVRLRGLVERLTTRIELNKHQLERKRT